MELKQSLNNNKPPFKEENFRRGSSSDTVGGGEDISFEGDNDFDLFSRQNPEKNVLLDKLISSTFSGEILKKITFEERKKPKDPDAEPEPNTLWMQFFEKIMLKSLENPFGITMSDIGFRINSVIKYSEFYMEPKQKREILNDLSFESQRYVPRIMEIFKDYNSKPAEPKKKQKKQKQLRNSMNYTTSGSKRKKLSKGDNTQMLKINKFKEDQRDQSNLDSPSIKPQGHTVKIKLNPPSLVAAAGDNNDNTNKRDSDKGNIGDTTSLNENNCDRTERTDKTDMVARSHHFSMDGRSNLQLRMTEREMYEDESSEEDNLIKAPKADVVVKSKPLFPKLEKYLADNRLNKMILNNKSINIEDLDNLKLEIKSYEKELISIKHFFNSGKAKKFEHLINFSHVNEELKISKVMKRITGKEKIEEHKKLIDKAIANLVLYQKQFSD